MRCATAAARRARTAAAVARRGAAAPAVVADSFGPPEVLQLRDRELPPAGKGQVVVRLGAAGVNPSDTYVRLGPHGPWAATPHLLPALPFTPGKDGAGEVTEVGEGVTSVKVGQRVYTTNAVTGTYASAAVCAAGTVYPLPDRVSFAQGACVGVPCATAYHALKHRARAAKGGKVFIHGASGAVGLAAVQLAKDAGCFVAGTAGTPQGAAAVQKAGADAVFSHREDGYLAKAKEVASGGYDVVLEMAAAANLTADMSITAKRGCVCIIGSKAEAHGFNPRLTMVPEIDIRGVFLASMTPEELKETHEALYDAMGRGALSPVVGMELPLRDAAKAHVEVMGPSAGGAVGNIVLIP